MNPATANALAVVFGLMIVLGIFLLIVAVVIFFKDRRK